MASIQNALVQLTQILEHCDHSNINHTNDEALALKIQDSLNIFDGINFRGCDRETVKKLANAIQSIQAVVNHQLLLSIDKTEQISGQILNLKNKLAEETKNISGGDASKISQFPNVNAIIAYFCDLNTNDENGAVLMDIMTILRKPMPFIASRTLLSCSRLQPGKKPPNSKRIILGAPVNPLKTEFQKLLKQNASNFDFYVLADSELVVCIPKGAYPNLTEIEKFAALDLRTDGSLKRISLNKILEPRPKDTQSTFNEFSNLFNENPNRFKLVYLCGHGGVGSPAGMSKENFNAFISFMEQQKCLGMILSSCYSGGQSSLLFLPDPDESKEGVSFPIMSQSIGDFPSVAEQSAESSIRDRLSMMKSLIENPGGSTYKKWYQALQEVESGLSKYWLNQVQLYLPHSRLSPAGFRPVGELLAGYSLTMAKLGKEILEPHFDPNEGLKLDGVDHLEILPLVVDIPLRFTEKDLVLISMFPGPSHQFIRQLNIRGEEDDTVLKWVDRLHEIYHFDVMETSSKIGLRKAFFIDTFQISNELVNHLIISFDCEYIFSECLYKKDGEYFYYDGKNNKKISALQYVLEAGIILSETTPLEKAAIAATAGLQDNKMFIEKLKEVKFLIPEVEYERLRALRPEDFEDFKRWFETIELEDQKAMLLMLAQVKQEKFVLTLMEEDQFSPDISDLRGNTLFSSAINQRMSKLLKYLNSKGVNDDQGCVGIALENKEYDKAKFLLKSGADPMKGNHSPLSQAVKSEDPKLIEMILKAQPMCFHPSYFFECIETGSADQVRAFFPFVSELMHQMKKTGNDDTPLITALKRGNREVLQVLFELYPDNFEYIIPIVMLRGNAADKLYGALDRTVRTARYLDQLIADNPELVKTIVNYRKCQNLQNLLFLKAVNAYPSLALDLLKTGAIQPEESVSSKYSIAPMISYLCERGNVELLQEASDRWQVPFQDPFFSLTLAKKNQDPTVVDFLTLEKAKNQASSS